MQTRGFKLNAFSAFQSTEEGLSLKCVRVVYLLYLTLKIVFFSLFNHLPTCTVHNSLPITCNIIVLEMIVVQCIWRWLPFADNRDGHQEGLLSRAKVVQIRKKESTLNKWSCQQRAAWIHLPLMLSVLPGNVIIHLTLCLGHDFHLVPLWLKG